MSSLHPLMNYRFIAHFLDQDLIELPFGKTLTSQLTSISSIAQRKSAGSNTCRINIQDDVTGIVFKAIQELYKLENFSVKIDMLDGCQGIIKSTLLTGCNVLRIKHSELTYGSGPGQRVEIKFPRVILDELEESNAKLLVAVLGNMVLDYTTGNEASPVVTSDLTVTYSDVTVS